MKILVVDDDPSKVSEIRASLQGYDDYIPHAIFVVETLADAVRVLNTHLFDLIVLDLLLPFMHGGVTDSRAGLELVQQLRSKNSLNNFTTVVGISAFPEEMEVHRVAFDQCGVLITKYDDDGAWKLTLKRILQDVSGRSSATISLDFLIFCALEVERGGYAHSGVEIISEAVTQGLNINYVRLRTLKESFGAIIRLSHMGLVAATREITVALGLYRTRIVCMSGICAGFAGHAALGQLVVASPAWEYQAGKWSSNGFEIAPEQVPLRPSTRTVVDQAITADNFRHHLEDGLSCDIVRPERQSIPILAPFATGSAVIADTERLAHIEKQHRKLAALDMETYGLYYAAHEAYSTVEHFFSIKCVVDLADDAKNNELHPYGCIVSARAAEKLIYALLQLGR